MQAIELLKFCEKIFKSMSEIGVKTDDCRHIAMYDEYKQMESKGFTYSNPDLRMSLMCISKVTSIDQWFDSMTHEVDHLQWEIMQYYDVDPGTEEAAWLQGYLVRMIIKAIAK